ncbi:MAG: hypothetical protein PUD81_02285, partial [Eggerthellales bacterium]|nr:hypothetical protein [Eggerthellales bacterium]
MKKKAFRKDSFAAKFAAAALSVTLAFGMTPAMAFAQPTETSGDSAMAALDAVELQSGTYSLDLSFSTGMINAAAGDNAPQLVVNGENAYVIFTETADKDANSYPKYDGAWLGKRSEAPAPDAAAVVNGIAVYDDNGAVDGFTYVLPTTKAAVEAALNDADPVDFYICVRYSDRYINSKGENANAGQWMGSKDNSFTMSNLVWTSASTELPKAPEVVEQVVEFETYVNNIGMMKIVSAAMVTNADGMFLRFALNGSGYKKMAWGIYEEVVAAGDGSADRGNGSWTNGYTNADGKIEFMLPMKEDVESIPVVAISESHYNKFVAGTEALGQCMYPRLITLDMDSLTITASDYAATQPLSVSVEGKAPAVTAVSLETVGGPASNAYVENATFTTDAQAAYLGTAEAAASATSGVVEAADGKLTITLTENNMGGGYAVKGGWDGKAAVAFKLADGTWVDTAVTVNKVAKTLAIEGEALPAQPVTATVSYTAQACGAFM